MAATISLSVIAAQIPFMAAWVMTGWMAVQGMSGMIYMAVTGMMCCWVAVGMIVFTAKMAMMSLLLVTGLTGLMAAPVMILFMTELAQIY